MRVNTPPRPVSYATFERKLIRLGFTRTEIAKPSALFFEHSATGATLIVPKGEPSDIVPLTNRVAARRTIQVYNLAPHLTTKPKNGASKKSNYKAALSNMMALSDKTPQPNK